MEFGVDFCTGAEARNMKRMQGNIAAEGGHEFFALGNRCCELLSDNVDGLLAFILCGLSK